MYGIGRAEAARFERDSRCFERDSKCFERDTKRARAPFRSYICRKHKFPHFRHRGSGAPPDLSFTLGCESVQPLLPVKLKRGHM